jgi:drug/metabolite transporter (DMT)-like permease
MPTKTSLPSNISENKTESPAVAAAPEAPAGSSTGDAAIPLAAWGMLLAVSFIWGNSFILIKKGLLAYAPGEVGALRIIFAALALSPIAIRHVGKLNGRQRGLLLVIGLVGSFIPAFLFALAQTRLASGVTGILNALTPLFTVLVGALFFSQKFTRRNGIGLAISFIGTIVLSLARAGGQLSGFNAYALLVVGATFCYGLNLNLIKNYLGGLRPVVITGVSLLLVLPAAAVFLFGFTDFIEHYQTQPTAGWSLAAVAALGVLGTAVALIIFNKLVQQTTAMFASFATYIIPIVAVVVGMLDGEELLPLHYAGMAGIILGVYIANRKRKPSLPAGR